MPHEYDYFIWPAADGPSAPPRSLWRRAGDQWEFYSLLDWSWHALPEEGPPFAPPKESLRTATPAEAHQLSTDRQRWVRYWAWYRARPRNPPERPLTVVRRRSSPELRLDECFTKHNRWEPTQAIVEAHLSQVSDPPRLVETDQETAERILREVRGINGATEL